MNKISLIYKKMQNYICTEPRSEVHWSEFWVTMNTYTGWSISARKSNIIRNMRIFYTKIKGFAFLQNSKILWNIQGIPLHWDSLMSYFKMTHPVHVITIDFRVKCDVPITILLFKNLCFWQLSKTFERIKSLFLNTGDFLQGHRLLFF